MAAAALALVAASLDAQPFGGDSTLTQPQIVVVYPRDSQVIAAVDSNFILGHLSGVNRPADYCLLINGQEVPVHPAGGFLAFLPIAPGDFTFTLAAYRRCHYLGMAFADSIGIGEPGGMEPRLLGVFSKSFAVRVPQRRVTLPSDTLMIRGDYRPPLGDLTLATGDRLRVSFEGTPGCCAWFAIPGLVDSVPMAEAEPQQQPYWGEAVFGAGAVPDSVKLGGVYTGFWDVPASARADSTGIEYYLVPLPASEILEKVWPCPLDPETTTGLCALSGYRVTVNDPSYPFTVRFTDSVQIIRHEPQKGYFTIFQPRDVEAVAVGAEGEWYKLRLSATQCGWIQKSTVQPLPKGILPPRSYVSSVRMYADRRTLKVEFPLSGKHPYRIVADDARTLRVQLFGVAGATDWIRYASGDKLVRIATWSQPEPDVYEFRLTLTRDIWGYDAYYVGNTLYLQLNRPPEDVRKLKNKTVVIDPGHSADPGAVGPTGLTEAEANLQIALELERILAAKGARVVMTRGDNRNVDLMERPVVAKLHDADLFISVHNNALPDGVNPFVNNGTSAYYYHPHSIELARLIHAEMVTATRLPDQGLYYGNLAVNRPTQYPAVLVECAFMMIPEQEAMLKTRDFRRDISEAIARGIERFLKGCDNGQ